MVKIVYFITELSIGGAQTALYRLLKGMNRERYDLHVVCLYNGDSYIAEQIRALSIPVYDLGMDSKVRLDAFVRLFWYLKSDKPSILHTWMFHANIPGRLIGRFARVPVIISSERTMGQEGFIRRLFNRVTVSLVDRVICVSRSVADFAAQTIKIPKSKLLVVPNGITLAEYDNLPGRESARAAFKLDAHAVIIGAIGRPRPVKGYEILLDAFARVALVDSTAHLLFVGEGPSRLILKTKVSSLGLNERVTFLDDQIDITRLLPAINLLAIPSLFEGMPNVALEAMAAGLPIIATSVGGTPEVVVDGKTGYLVPPRNPDALADAILKLLDNPDLCLRMGRAGRERVKKHFSIERTIKKTEQIYEDLLAVMD